MSKNPKWEALKECLTGSEPVEVHGTMTIDEKQLETLRRQGTVTLSKEQLENFEVSKVREERDDVDDVGGLEELKVRLGLKDALSVSVQQLEEVKKAEAERRVKEQDRWKDSPVGMTEPLIPPAHVQMLNRDPRIDELAQRIDTAILLFERDSRIQELEQRINTVVEHMVDYAEGAAQMSLDLQNLKRTRDESKATSEATSEAEVAFARNCEMRALEAELEALRAKREAMSAANTEWQIADRGLAYVEGAFAEVRDQVRQIAARLRGLQQS